MRAWLRRVLETATQFTLVTLLGLICLAWTVFALPLLLVLPERIGTRVGRMGIRVGFRFYVWIIGGIGVYRLDVAALRTLQGGPALVLAPNHPSLIDALFVIAHDSNVACVLKSSVMNNLFLGAGARLARYVRNEPPRQMIAAAVRELGRGSVLLLFPEGTRTTRAPVNRLRGSVAIIAKHAGVPVQTLIIEQDSPFLSKGWSLLRPARFPIRYRVRLGRRFAAPSDVHAFTEQLEQYFRDELAASAQGVWLAERHGAVAPP